LIVASAFTREDCAAKAGQLTAEPTMRGGGPDVSEMPRLDSFDEEFGREPAAILRGQRRKGRLRVSALVVLLLGAGVVSALALAWLNTKGWLRFEVQSAPSSQQYATREGSDEQIDRLRREVEALKKEIGDLTQAQQQSDDTITSLKAGEQEPRDPVSSAYWYSDLAARHFGVESQPMPGMVAPAPRWWATAHPVFRNARKRDGGAPLSLEAPQ
jgi:hypothetical protein